VKVDERTGGRQSHEESAVKAGELGEKKRSVDSLGERRGWMEVLG